MRILLFIVLSCGGCSLLFEASPIDLPRTDASSDSGSATDASSPDAVPPDESHLVFVTSRNYNGLLGGLAGADAECQSLAEVAQISGTFQAWLSDTNSSPSTRMTRSTTPYRLTSGQIVADNWDDLVDGTLKTRINQDESGDPIGGEFVCIGGEVWSNTLANGERASMNHCASWTSNIDVGNAGSTNKMDADWSDSCPSVTCATQLPLYCFEQ